MSATSPQSSGVLGRRIGAGLIDLLVLLAVFVGLAVLIGTAESEGGSTAVALNGWPAVLYFALALAYYGVPEALTGRTLGKRLAGLRVVSSDGGRASTGQIAGRTALRLVDGIFFYLVGLVTILATRERRQRIGDLAANTAVVRD